MNNNTNSKTQNSYFLITILISFFIFLSISIHDVLAQEIVINEVMSSNALTLSDEDGDFPDWIELYNNGTISVNLADWGLSDDPADPPKWIFPEIELAPKSFLLVFASGKDRKDVLVEWESVLRVGDSCRYLNVTQNISASWVNPDFNDANWLLGKTGLGYGDGDDSTVIPQAKCVYLRQKFNLADVNAVEKIFLHIDYDDAFVAYLNGVEVARANIGTAGIRPSFGTSANVPHEASMYRGLPPEKFDLSSVKGLLKTGQNCLAIEVHNYQNNSSDLSIIPFLSIGYNCSGLSVRGPAPQLHLPLSGLHTNFKIKSSGEPLLLSDANGHVVDIFDEDSIPADVSKGRYPDGSSDWFFFKDPTPDQPNKSDGYQNFASGVVSSLTPGFYEHSVTVALRPEKGDGTIFYTMDGSVPDEGAQTYQSPILISKTTVLRARIIEKGALPGPVLTHTYFINENTDLPVVSISTNPPNLWDYNSGIYVMGPNAGTDYPYFGANFWQDWEIPAHIEFFEDDKTLGFSTNCGAKIYGAWSRALPQKSLALFFRGRYGLAELNYPVFPDLNVQSFEALVLRNSGNDWSSTMMRDGFMQSLVSNLDMDKQAYRPAVVFLNGQYWGIHNIREKINEHFLASHHHVDPEDIDLLEGNQNVIDGDNERYQEMIHYIESHTMNSDESRAYLERQMDVNEYFDYMITEIYLNNTDWPGNNIKYWRDYSPGGRWRWILYDTDFGFGLFDDKGYMKNTLEFALEENGPGWPNPPWSTFLFRKILENETLKKRFINYFADNLNVTFATNRVLKILQNTKNQILAEMPRHLNRWQQSYSDWQSNTDRLVTFARFRKAYCWQHLMQHFDLSSMVNVEITLADSGMGQIKLNDHILTGQNFNGYYFPEIRIKIEAIPKSGYRFVGWQGSFTTPNRDLQFFPYKSVQLTAQFEKSETTSGNIVINEINYHSADSFDSGDWIELCNPTQQDKDCSGWIFKDEKDDHKFVFPANTIVPADSYLVLIASQTKFSSCFPNVHNIIGSFDFGLSASGELIRLYDSEGHLIDSLVYDDKAPWPEQADGEGATLELLNPFRDNRLAENWAASAGHGTPGRQNSVFTSVKMKNKSPLVQDFILFQNYPNPFNPQTKIVYQLAKGGDVHLAVYDALGRIVSVLVQGKQAAGKHSVIFKADQLASGIYFCVLKYNHSGTRIKKIVLLR